MFAVPNTQVRWLLPSRGPGFIRRTFLKAFVMDKVTFRLVFVQPPATFFLFTSMEPSLLEKLVVSQVNKFPAFYVTYSFVTASTKARPVSLSSNLIKIHFNIILPSKPWPSQRSLSFTFPHQNPVCTSSFLCTCYTSRPTMKLFIMLFPHPS